MQATTTQVQQLSKLVQLVGNNIELEHWHELSWLRNKLSVVLSCDTYERGLWGWLLTQLVQLSGDPDVEAASWPEKGTVLGIVNEIPASRNWKKTEARKLDQLKLSVLCGIAGSCGRALSGAGRELCFLEP